MAFRMDGDDGFMDVLLPDGRVVRADILEEVDTISSLVPEKATFRQLAPLVEHIEKKFGIRVSTKTADAYVESVMDAFQALKKNTTTTPASASSTDSPPAESAGESSTDSWRTSPDSAPSA